MLRIFTRNVLLTLTICLNCGIAVAADDQYWSVTIVEDTAIIRAAPKTAVKFVRSTLDQLQTAGIEKLTLSSEAPATLLDDSKSSYTVSVVDGLAQIRVTNDLPKKHLESVIKSLRTAGIDFVNVSKVSR